MKASACYSRKEAVEFSSYETRIVRGNELWLCEYVPLASGYYLRGHELSAAVSTVTSCFARSLRPFFFYFACTARTDLGLGLKTEK